MKSIKIIYRTRYDEIHWQIKNGIMEQERNAQKLIRREPYIINSQLYNGHSMIERKQKGSLSPWRQKAVIRALPALYATSGKPFEPPGVPFILLLLYLSPAYLVWPLVVNHKRTNFIFNLNKSKTCTQCSNCL